LTGKLLTVYKQQIKDLKLIPSKGGCFEVTVNGELIYSKLESGQFPDEKWVVEALRKKLKA
jgi:selenoprotein W-related protein